MENFVPGLRESVLALTGTLRVVVFFVCVVGLMVQVHAARADMEGLTRPLGRAIVIVALVATLPTWFEFTEKLFLSTANVIEAGYTEHPMRTATLLRDTVQERSDSGFSLRRIGESLYRAFLWAAAKLIVLVGSLLKSVPGYLGYGIFGLLMAVLWVGVDIGVLAGLLVAIAAGCKHPPPGGRAIRRCDRPFGRGVPSLVCHAGESPVRHL